LLMTDDDRDSVLVVCVKRQRLYHHPPLPTYLTYPTPTYSPAIDGRYRCGR